MPESIPPEAAARETVAGARERAPVATGDELSALLHHPSSDVLLALLDNPALDEPQLCLLLGRNDLPGEILEEVGRRKPLLKSYRVKKALCFHPRGPRLVTLRLIRDLYLMDLVHLLQHSNRFASPAQRTFGHHSFLPATTHRLRPSRTCCPGDRS